MSISAALSNAVSGLSAVSRSAELVSANVANAMTDGYGRRELTLSSGTVGGQGAGVTIVGVKRIVNETALGDRRLSDAAMEYHQARANFFTEIELSMGTPEDPSSLSAHMGRFDQSLLVAAGNPSSDIKLSAVLDAASALTGKFNAVSANLQAERQRADKSIGTYVGQINDALEGVHQLNKKIRHQLSSGGGAAALMDQRQTIIDRLASLIPLQTVPRDHGQVALLTTNGTTLVDFRAAQFEFSVTPTITPDQSLASGALSGLTISGASSASGTALESISGGKLAAAFELRDSDIPTLQGNLDALALDLAQRAVAADISLSPGDAGLFTDAGGVATAVDVEGLSNRLSVNSAVIPSAGGDLWRIRDGVSATLPGNASDNALLTRSSDVLGVQSQPTTDTFNNAGSASDLIGDLLSQVGQDRHASLARQSFQAASSEAFRALELEGGVDTDQELQKLILIEQNFAANAKVIQAVDDMLQSLLRI